jgi:hypothetical protein
LDEFSNIVDKFNSMPTGPHKADLFRYYFIYIKGGVYIDYDAMLEIDIEDIIQEYSFFSVNSSVISNSIFQGFIGSTPKNDIIYKALKNTYNIDCVRLSQEYHLLCRNLFTIIREGNHNSDNNIKLYHEGYYDDDTWKCFNDDNQIILLHYWRNKIIPNKIF